MMEWKTLLSRECNQTRLGEAEALKGARRVSPFVPRVRDH